MEKELLGVVLAGGRSSRMGYDKALMEIHGGVRQIDYLSNLLGKFCMSVAISSRLVNSAVTEARKDLVALVDDTTIEGPLAGVVAGLEKSENGVLVVACDMPFLDPYSLLQLVSNRDRQALATYFNGSDDKPEPLCAIYEKGALPALLDRVSKGWLSLRRFLMDDDTTQIPLARSRLLANVNTPEEAEAARRELAD